MNLKIIAAMLKSKAGNSHSTYYVLTVINHSYSPGN